MSPGFQGLGPDNRIATFGRGGSDTSAVAVAAAINADAATSTPTSTASTPPTRASSAARTAEKIAYEEMLEMASLGAKVLQTRSVELAMLQGVRVLVRSSFDDAGPCRAWRRPISWHARLR